MKTIAYRDGRSIHIARVWPDGEEDEEEPRTYVNWTRASDHACLYEEYDLVHHVRCRICGHIRERDSVPYFRKC